MSALDDEKCIPENAAKKHEEQCENVTSETHLSMQRYGLERLQNVGEKSA